jgi:1-acyl-sn-glycerol-3-phosphate acyltransferase
MMLLAVFGTLPTILTVNRFGAGIRVDHRMLDEFMLNWWTRTLCRVFGIRIRVKGRVMSGPVLIVSNHISWMDILVLHSSAAMGFVSKAEIANWPFIGFLARLSHTVFHERGSQDSASSVTSVMKERFSRGGRIAIFPEGGIKPGDEVNVFHARMFKAAIESKTLVQPVMIRYIRKGQRDPDVIFRPDENFIRNFFRLLGRPGSICEVRYLPGIDAAGRPRKSVAEEARVSVVAAFEEPVNP